MLYKETGGSGAIASVLPTSCSPCPSGWVTNVSGSASCFSCKNF
jgi:hypothetical protein